MWWKVGITLLTGGELEVSLLLVLLPGGLVCISKATLWLLLNYWSWRGQLISLTCTERSWSKVTCFVKLEAIQCYLTPNPFLPPSHMSLPSSQEVRWLMWMVCCSISLNKFIVSACGICSVCCCWCGGVRPLAETVCEGSERIGLIGFQPHESCHLAQRGALEVSGAVIRQQSNCEETAKSAVRHWWHTYSQWGKNANKYSV